jgi:hypothetical protein
MNQHKVNWEVKHRLASIITGVVLLTMLGSRSFAFAAISISIVSNKAEGNSAFNVIVKDNPGTQLVMYVNGKSSSKATVNKKDLATFSKVKFTNTGKVTFKVVLQNKSHKSYQQAISFTRYYKVSGGKLSFLVNKPTTPSTTKTTSKVESRKVSGTAVTLGAGTFNGGTDVAVGLYNVTTVPGQSGNFIVSGTDEYDEILGVSDGQGEPEIRVQISKGDSIQISELSQVVFTPVSTPYVTTYTTTNLYAGTFTVGQDIGAGRYVATTTAGSSGNFIVTGVDNVDEILGVSDGQGVPSVTTNLTNGDIISISGLTEVTLTTTK